jgi:uncharacterized phiE125 gp8 family phage protein
MGLTLVTPPTAEPVPLDGDGSAKQHLRVDTTDEDGYISGLIIAAREYCEAYQGRAYVTQTWELSLDCWPARDWIQIPKPPLQAVESIAYRLADGTEQILDPSCYAVDPKSQPGRLALRQGCSWPSGELWPLGAITIRFVAGYGDPDKVPQRAKQAMLLLIGHWFEHREAVLTGSISKEIEFAVRALLGSERRWA